MFKRYYLKKMRLRKSLGNIFPHRIGSWIQELFFIANIQVGKTDSGSLIYLIVVLSFLLFFVVRIKDKLKIKIKVISKNFYHAFYGICAAS